MNAPEAPPIPIRLADRPTIGGLVVPWVTGRSPDGRYRLGAIDAHHHRSAINDRRCQTCGQRLDRDRIVFAMRDADLRRMVSPEGGMHPECGRYSATACPMLAGHMAYHRRHPGTAHVAWAEYLGDPDDARPGAPAQPWHLAWVDGYRPITDPLNDMPAALLLPENLLRIRSIAAPPAWQPPR